MALPALFLGPLLGFGKEILERFVPDPEKRREALVEMQKMADTKYIAELQAASSVIVSEASSGSWIKQNWRPLVMLWFAGLVGAHWMGFTPENITDDVVTELLALVKIGLGGYVVGRSVEKVAPSIVQAIQTRT